MPGTAAWHEDHVSLDVARAFALHADLTGDAEFLRTKAWPVLSGVSEWLTSRVTLRRGAIDRRNTSGNDALYFKATATKRVARMQHVVEHDHALRMQSRLGERQIGGERLARMIAVEVPEADQASKRFPDVVGPEIRIRRRLPGVLALGSCILLGSLILVAFAEWIRRRGTGAATLDLAPAT